ncbi:MAG: hypothetical protein LBL70_02475 [Treponema sp.]|jgi:hypothetical protein|nr:hypothetical protein [Treponema sp.]
MDYKKSFERFKEQNVFVKTTSPSPIDGAQKVALNRKGNILYNQGDIEGAKRIFLTTGYSDGLSRVGDYYKSKGRVLDALRMYWIAPDHSKSEIIIEQLSALIKKILQEEKEDRSNE